MLQYCIVPNSFNSIFWGKILWHQYSTPCLGVVSLECYSIQGMYRIVFFSCKRWKCSYIQILIIIHETTFFPLLFSFSFLFLSSFILLSYPFSSLISSFFFFFFLKQNVSRNVITASKTWNKGKEIHRKYNCQMVVYVKDQQGRLHFRKHTQRQQSKWVALRWWHFACEINAQNCA